MATIKETKALTPGQRFTMKVEASFNDLISSGQDARQFTEHEKSLVRGYFIAIDKALKLAEADRVRKNAKNRDHEKYDNNLPYSWTTINLQQLSIDLAHYARLGYDMQMKNVLFPIPFKDNKANLYTINLMPGYNGIRQEAAHYALDVFSSVTVEVVYQTDTFKVIKKDAAHPFDSYVFEVTNPFERGPIVGVFGYVQYDDPVKNKLLVFSRKEVEKRKPKYASPEFWGGERGGEHIDGWEAEMYEKTMYRAICSEKYILRDPAKVDEDYRVIQQRRDEFSMQIPQTPDEEADENANAVPISIEDQPAAAIEPPKEVPQMMPDAYTVTEPAQISLDDIPAEADF